MKKKISGVLLAVVFCLGSSAAAFAEDGQIDYSQWDSNAHYPADVRWTQLFTPVKFLMDRNIITGTEDGLFHPERPVTRAEFAAMIARATNAPGVATNPSGFTDLAGYGWAEPYISTVVAAGLMRGVGDGQFAPGENVTYAEVITVLIRMNEGAANVAESMAPTWPQNYILYAEIYNMKGNVVIRDWNAPATRGDTATLLYRRIPTSTPITNTGLRFLAIERGAADEQTAAADPYWENRYLVSTKKTAGNTVSISIVAADPEALISTHGRQGKGALVVDYTLTSPLPNNFNFSIHLDMKVQFYTLVIRDASGE